MPFLDRSGVRLHYVSRGEPDGGPVVFLHGITSDSVHAWVEGGAIPYLSARPRHGLRFLLLDQRGHGRSDLPAGPEAYTWSILVEDVLALLDREKIASAHLVGYSMGAEVALRLGVASPERVRSLFLGGCGRGAYDKASLSRARARIASRAERFRDPDPGMIARRLRSEAGVAKLLADPAWGARARALARAWQGAALGLAQAHTLIGADALGGLHVPCRIAVGSDDPLYGPKAGRASGAALARAIPGATYLEIPGAEHGDAFRRAAFHEAVAGFLPAGRSVGR
ncbi:MAG: alpha/beta fold hydrolase [Planctomycetes bacterium]|nr:alpha/beta fold hydrolase [Planctomycetota bacterium]